MEKLRIGPWTVHPALNLLERGSRSVRIEPRAMDVLTFLAGRPGEVVSVEELMSAVWKGVVVGDGSVYLAIKQLRRALEEPGDGLRYIETIPKRGYRLAVPVERDEGADISTGAAEEAAGTRPVATLRPARQSRSWVAAAAAAGVAALALAVVWVRHDGGEPVLATRSVAVLPFENLSADPTQAYFADGVTEEILGTLGGVHGLRVIGRTSSFAFRDRKEDRRAIARVLDVDHVLEGSVRRSGDQVRISARLVEVASGEQLWSRTFERKLDDVFAIQTEIATAAARALQVTLRVGEVAEEPGMTRNVAAYDEFLRARALNLEGSWPQAVASLQRAVALDPEFAAGWAGLHLIYANGAMRMPPEQAVDWMHNSDEALERARGLVPDAPSVLLATGIREVRRGNWLAAAPFYDALQPAYARYGSANQAWAPRGVFLMYVGRAREAIPLLERARAEDPLSPGLANFVSQAYLARGDTRAALAEVDRGIALNVGGHFAHALNFWIAMNAGDRREIERRLASFRESAPAPSRTYDLARFLDAPADGIAEIRRMAPSATGEETVLLALWAAYFDAPELSLELIAPATRFGETMPALWQPLMRDVRRLPAFSTLMRESGLVDYWRVHGWPDFCRPLDQGALTCG